MSLVQDLADQLRVVREDLPIAEVSAAAERLRMAGGLLAWVMHATGDPQRVPQLGGAADRLESAAGLMRSAHDALDAYALALGLAADSVGTTQSWGAAAPVVPAQTRTTDAPLSDWWAERVRVLAGRDALDDLITSAATDDPAETSTELLRRCVSATLDERPAKLHRELGSAGPAVGLGLAAVAPPLLRHLAAELVGHPPRLEDLARVRRAALVHTGLLPELPPEAAEEIVARVCHATPQRRGEGSPTHPVDAAAAAVLITAGLLAATGRGASELHAVVEEEQRRRNAAADSTMRRALRVGDPSRRRSAVDALADETPVGGAS
ncbi:MAG: hypothetical protein HOU81_04870 [Hamadaea sp.]|uniref:hypothetical protein n=1 Tax=Hamadaea sp. TaxID=2024425 RepID=UPI00179A9D73|nr:hypothetical protein [Hamadaea sp.]NUR70130.1 hypothetical protein [Hamadaea sp.]NUT23632.1 hypothetical protein [Hamadaea sp.]